jgi:hypothetical protein
MNDGIRVSGGEREAKEESWGSAEWGSLCLSSLVDCQGGGVWGQSHSSSSQGEAASGASLTFDGSGCSVHELGGLTSTQMWKHLLSLNFFSIKTTTRLL